MVQPSKYDFRVNPIYQVDFQCEASGKRVSATKRRIRFRFGFSNREAIEQGLTGTDCRGEEHEVNIVWSLTSGKRLVIYDGREMHFTAGKRTENRFEASWNIAGGHVVKVIAHAAPPLFNTPGFRQFDLLLDGCSFFDMPKIYELGTKKSRGRPALPAASPTSVAAPSHFATPPAYETYDESPRFYARPEGDQRSYYSAPTPVVAAPASTSRAPMPRMHSLPPVEPVDLFATPNTSNQDYLATPMPVAQYHQHQPTQQTAVVDEFAPVAPPAPTFQQVSNQILSNYAPQQPAYPALANTPYYAEHEYQYSSSTAVVADDEEAQPVAQTNKPKTGEKPVLKATMAPLSIAEMETRDQAPLSEVERAVKSLVNLDDITHALETPEQAKYQRKKKEQESKSKPLPPTSPVWHLGPKPALKDIRQHADPRPAPKKEIMRTHAFDPAAVQAGMMVVYGATMPQQQGFGAGVHPSHYSGYNNQGYQYNQQRPMYAGY